MSSRVGDGRAFGLVGGRAHPEPNGVPPRVFTLGAAAKLCRVSPRCCQKWVDSGRLKGYRMPGSDHRRVAADDLVAFLRASGMPVPPELAGSLRTAAVWVPDPPPGAEVVSPAVAGALAAKGELASVVVGLADGLASAVGLARDVRGIDSGVRLVLVLAADRGRGEVPGGLFDEVTG
jgi:two-component system response regulator RpaA